METLKELHYFFTANARIQKSARTATLRRDRKRLHAIAEKAYRAAAATVKTEMDKAANAKDQADAA